ncbi:MAG: phenylpropionate dioxygenase [Bordetella sp. SCN 68-11]|mgnify:CR=1 FL=1|nr:aromatic-ring-hydroxylating dioxygenase subunit beta [Rhodospirillales bacterium]ODU67472.1 MAG: phenylpropionate dioxygenase [Bordetella sp. SCN 68-11]OJY74586.1 MAG: phenylpropionate dioxygenase [Rhodospirillales bacterium 70-18]
MITEADLIGFVRHEARLIDEQHFDEWLALFTPDGRYWMPLEMGQADPLLHNSLFYDDLVLLRIRVERLKGAKTYSQKPKSRCHHLLQTPTVEIADHAAGRFETWTPFHYVETRLDEQTLFAGWSRHSLVLIEGALRIRLKRVDLVNCDSAFGNIQLFM